ncbi:LysM peptidoglycan-binding domain-containing protein [Paenibacillus pinisoli]|uniref:LysM peptidoglycan-binding domain-containing protein n=1 Tax=Paenibacillus pinisoli TaxID=1276110 RepID=A0A3A6PJY2_9BACL|nr:LysM peptidoglycan-binding domain-containing protein [Paenibacillus pinisoli]RJX40056.1 LysM peptidoglycan-binding domain-containing protein [Paenibacillus pinisoli]
MEIYGVELSFNNKAKGEVFQLPVNPSSMEVSESGQSKGYNVASLGEINVIKDRKLTEYSMSGIFPAQHYPFIAESLTSPNNKAKKTPDEKEQKEQKKPEKVILLKPDVYIKKIESWMVTKRPIRFIFSSSTYDINTPASIESFEWKEVAGGGGDIEYSIKLRKYIFYAARKIVQKTANGTTTASTQAASSAPRPNEKQQAKTYTLVSGDTLWKVAQTQLGNGARWKEIQNLNGIKDADLKRLSIGKVLKLP